MSAQLKQFMDQAGSLWQEGKLVDKVATAFTSSQTAHGGQETTILALNNTLYHWGMLILPSATRFARYCRLSAICTGSSFVSGHTVTGPDEPALALARYQGQRLARYAAVIAEARRAEAFDFPRPKPENFHAATLS